ncbi:MAG: 5-methyltetrahydrofolate--homocysteine methyltransferase [Chloroflexi bacterium]|jgi:S-methylmethionine-dependent homocysteine/selenocysteine methylase|nr:MAG: 5-methyltetrahydrofolate--homocysteine methyltransferase [Chloroflexota bacterium]
MFVLDQRLRDGEFLLLDGAIGTELQRIGVPMDDVAWCARAMRDHPDLVRALHENYIRAGADILTTNTFSAARHVLEAAGMGGLVDDMNFKAVRLARQARDNIDVPRNVAIAGSISRFGGRQTAPAILEANYREQAGILAESGVDMLLLEFLGGPISNIEIATKEAISTGLPVWLSLSCWIDEGQEARLGNRGHRSTGRDQGPWDLVSEDPLFSEAIDRLMPLGATALLVIHSEIYDVIPALEAMRKNWDGPIGAYPHSGDWVGPNWQFVNMISPEDYVEAARDWRQQGAQIVGGCCGIGENYIKLLRNAFPG